MPSDSVVTPLLHRRTLRTPRETPLLCSRQAQMNLWGFQVARPHFHHVRWGIHFCDPWIQTSRFVIRLLSHFQTFSGYPILSDACLMFIIPFPGYANLRHSHTVGLSRCTCKLVLAALGCVCSSETFFFGGMNMILSAI